jgi:hypothetical protein
MNFGDCPYCDGFIGMLAMPERTPAWAKVECESCGKDVWYKFSRVDPEAWTVEAFEKRFIVDEENRGITDTGKPARDDVLSDDLKSLMDIPKLISSGVIDAAIKMREREEKRARMSCIVCGELALNDTVIPVCDACKKKTQPVTQFEATRPLVGDKDGRVKVTINGEEYTGYIVPVSADEDADMRLVLENSPVPQIINGPDMVRAKVDAMYSFKDEIHASRRLADTINELSRKFEGMICPVVFRRIHGWRRFFMPLWWRIRNNKPSQ